VNTLTSTHNYVEAVAAHLDDLPEAERRDLLEDLEQHIAEVAAEAEGTLEQILGSPEAYARELRTSAGLPPNDEKLAASLVQRGLSSAPVRWVRRTLDTAPARAVREFLPQLRPAWWVGRGYLGVLVVNAGLYRLGREGGSYNWDFILPIPRLGGSTLVGVAAIIAAVWVSVALGRRAAEDRGLRMLNWAANAATVVVLLAVIANPIPYARFLPTSAPAIEYVEYYGSEWLQHPDGSEISNICAYDSSLRPIDRVLLYDQEGRPISNTVPMPGPDEVWGDEIHGFYSFEAEAFDRPDTDDLADTRELANSFPRSYTFDHRTGRVVPFECPTLGQAPDEDPGTEGDEAGVEDG
jgi:hypothetical protein